MATTPHHPPAADEKIELGSAGNLIKLAAGLVGFVGLTLAIIASMNDPEYGWARFYHAYLTSYAFVLSIAIGSLGFVLLSHLFKAGWSVNLRRIPETLAATLPVLGLFAIPILVTVNRQDALLYPWAVNLAEAPAKAQSAATADPLPGQFADASRSFQLLTAATAVSPAASADAPVGTEADPSSADQKETKDIGYHAAVGYRDFGEFTTAKQPWLSSWFFTLRVVVYFIVWSVIAWYFYNASRGQDRKPDHLVTRRLSILSAPALLLFALTVTFAAFDLLKSLDHHWYSTMFGIYFFSNAMIATFAAIIIILNVLQRTGYLTQSINKEHFHDLGKLLFAFTFFWGYIAFSQYMLQWYSSIPEFMGWWARRSATQNTPMEGQFFSPEWAAVSLSLAVGHLLIPFAFLLSRHIKRNRDLLLIGAVWMLVFSWIDIFWLVMPELDNGRWVVGVPEFAAAGGLIGLFVTVFVLLLEREKLRPINDPRVKESMAFHNI